MSGKKIIVGLVLLVLLVLSGVWGVKRRQCKARGAAFEAKVEKLKRDAAARLKPGTKKEDVQRFFAENGFTADFDRFSEATGTIHASGCAPFGCGEDTALIGLKVKVDQAGTAQSAPVIVGMYTNCL